ncbi:unnamed protein product [Blumeria hordei]|uniref:F-box domain-containing protein n=1 Tax=Blumeria hordei TaxID=2867405 RepID=A0A383UQW9_BLUHO|nr:unnamed protein product [Blumeria hordei]
MLSDSHDPLRILPLEIVGIIFEHLILRDRMICLAVSKSWNILLQSTKTLWTTLYTSRTCLHIPLKALENYLRRSNYAVDSALLHLRSFGNKPNVRYLMDTCHGLKDFRIYGEGSLVQSQAAVLATARGIQKLHILQRIHTNFSIMILAIKACRKTLREAKFFCVTGYDNESETLWPKMNALTSIYLDLCNNGYIKFSDLIVAAPNLRSTVIVNCPSTDGFRLDMTLWHDLERLDLTNTRLNCYPKLPPRIKHLILDGSCDLCFSSIIDDGIYSLPFLETFSFQHNKIDISCIFTITDSCIRAKNLKTLRLGGIEISYPSDNFLRDYFPPSPTVEELSMSQLWSWDEDVIEVIKLYPNLKKVDLSDNQITKITIKELVHIGVKSIIIDECSGVDSETVDMARAEGVYVSQRFTDESTSSFGQS